jgi:hypothetical protein
MVGGAHPTVSASFSRFHVILRYSSAMRIFLCMALLKTIAAASASAQSASQPATGYSEPGVLCEIADRRINEASGLAASRRFAGCYYTINDSGNDPFVFLIDPQGKTKAVIRLDAENVDWEDLALAPPPAAASQPASGPTSSGGADFDVCVADVGDNRRQRPFVRVLRFAESAVRDDREESRVKPREYRFRYADGPQNVEAFFVAASGDGFFITKRDDGRAVLYVLPAPWRSDEPAVLTPRGDVRIEKSVPLEAMVTGAAIAPDASRIALRTYACGWEWRIPAAADTPTIAAILTRQSPRRVTLAPEAQGEAIAYSLDSAVLLTISEQVPTAIFECRR